MLLKEKIRCSECQEMTFEGNTISEYGVTTKFKNTRNVCDSCFERLLEC